MAIEPKSPRKRAVKKSSKKSLSAGTTPEPTEATAEVTEAAPKRAKKAAAIPVPIFPSSSRVEAPAEAAKRQLSWAKESCKGRQACKVSEEKEEVSAPAGDTEDSESRGNRNRRRRRGGRGRRKPNGEGVDTQEDSDNESEDSSEDSTESADGTHTVVAVAVAQLVKALHQVKPSMKMALSQLLRSAKSVKRQSAHHAIVQNVELVTAVIATVIVAATILANTASHIAAVEHHY